MKLCLTHDEMWGQLPHVQNANRKNVNPTFSHCQHRQLINAFLTPIHCISAWKLFFFSSTRLFYSWITFSITFTLHISQNTCQHSWRVLSAACIAPAVRYSPVKSPSWRSDHPKLHCWVQPTSLNFQEKNKKLQGTVKMRFITNFHENAKAESSLRFWSLHFPPASWKLPRTTEKRTALWNLPSCPQFTWPQIQLFVVSPDLKISQ